MLMTIRKASQTEARAIAELHVAGWKQTYQGIFPENVLAALDVKERETWWRHILERPRTLTDVVISEYGEVVGVVSGGPLRDTSIAGYDGELYAIYLAPEVQGMGLGRKLFLSMARQLYEHHFSSMVIWLARKNSARYFYEKFGPVEVARTINQYGVEDAAYGYNLKDLLDRDKKDKGW